MHAVSPPLDYPQKGGGTLGGRVVPVLASSWSS